MSKDKALFTLTGMTEADEYVVDGAWKVYESHGLPLDMIFTTFQTKKWIPDWILLYKQMRASGMKHDRIFSKLEEAILDSYNKKYCDVVLSTLNKIFGTI